MWQTFLKKVSEFTATWQTPYNTQKCCLKCNKHLFYINRYTKKRKKKKICNLSAGNEGRNSKTELQVHELMPWGLRRLRSEVQGLMEGARCEYPPAVPLVSLCTRQAAGRETLAQAKIPGGVS